MSDFSDTDKIAQRLTSSTKKLHDMASAVGSAKQVREFVGELRRNALSAEVVKFLKEGDSSAAAEHKARASEAYNQRLDTLMKHYESAEQTLSQWQAENASYDAARSLLSFNKETLRSLDG